MSLVSQATPEGDNFKPVAIFRLHQLALMFHHEWPQFTYIRLSNCFSKLKEHFVVKGLLITGQRDCRLF